MKPIMLRNHALQRMTENGLTNTLVISVARNPAWASPDPQRPGIEQRFGQIPGRPGKWLRVACVEEKTIFAFCRCFPIAMRGRPMVPQMTYDPEADAVYVTLSDKPPYDGADVSRGVTFHFAKDGRVVGVEILPASTTLAPGEWKNAPLPEVADVHAAE